MSTSGLGQQPTRGYRGKQRRAATKLILRAAVTVALVAAVTWRLDLDAFSEKARSLDISWLGAAFAVVFAAIAVSAWKWGAILAWRSRPLPGSRLIRHYLVGLFFNNVLPTTVGGDAVRAWEASREIGDVPEAVGSVITERLIAAAALGVTAVLGLPFVDTGPRLLLFVAGFLVVDFLLVALFLLPRWAERAAAGALPARFARARGTLATTVVVIRETLRTPRLFVKVLILSIAFQILVAAVNVCIFQAMGMEVSLGWCVVYTPMIFTVTMLPISLSGLGVREAAYWYFFSQQGVGQADAVSASLLFFAIVGIASLPGAALFALGRRDGNAAAAAAAAAAAVEVASP